MQGNHNELKILLQIHLIASRINQELRKTRGNTSVFKGDFRPKNSGRLIRWRGGIDRHDHTTIMAHQLEVIMAPDFAMIEPRSRDDRATIAH